MYSSFLSGIIIVFNVILVFYICSLHCMPFAKPCPSHSVSKFHQVWSLSHLWFWSFLFTIVIQLVNFTLNSALGSLMHRNVPYRKSISLPLRHIILIFHRLWSFAFLCAPGSMYNNSSYKFVQQKWSVSHTRCQVLLQQYLEELQEPWHW